MPSFCVKCGAPLSSGPFCVKCGADARPGSSTPEPTPQPTSQPTPANTVPTEITQPVAITTEGEKKMSPWVTLGIAALVLFVVGGAMAAAGVYYVAHRVSQKIHEEAGGLLNSDSDSKNANSSSSGSSSSSDPSSTEGSGIDACKLLSKEDVSAAIGVEIIRAEPGDNSCNYIAKGDRADMTAKHVAAMAATRGGADKKSQQMVQNIAGGMFKVFQSESHDKEDTSGEVPVLNFSVDQNNAEAQMRLNAKMLGRLGPTDGIPGVGDQAFISGDSMMMVRKGKSLVRIMYMTCPCGTEAITPLAKKIADAL
jgi:hypothetical protein